MSDTEKLKSHITIRTEEKSALILVGNSGAGKGTFTRSLAHLGVGFGYLGSGDLLREYIEKNPAFGKIIQSYTSSGEHVPNDLLMPLITGWFMPLVDYRLAVLDGFPRNVPQVEPALEMLHEHGFVDVRCLYIDTPAQKCAEHLIKQAEESNGKRKDDHPEALARRLSIFEEKVKPILGVLKQKCDKFLHIETIHHNLKDRVVVRDIAYELGIIC